MGHNKRTAIVTPSYSGDFERCKLLCESIDVNMLGEWSHYILVESGDMDLFRELDSSRRHIIDEREILPGWLRAFNDPFSGGKRRVWLSPFTPPLRGWHVQQLRTLGIGRLIDEDLILSVDSDVVLVRKFDPVLMWAGDTMRFYRRDNAITAGMEEHVGWCRRAARILKLEDISGPPPFHDYVNTLIGWRRETLNDMLDYIEKVNGTSWVRAIARRRNFSECIIYGRYVDEVLGGAGHRPDPRPLTHVLWGKTGDGETPVGLGDFIAGLNPGQVAIGIQSFIGHDINDIRRLLESNA